MKTVISSLVLAIFSVVGCGVETNTIDVKPPINSISPVDKVVLLSIPSSIPATPGQPVIAPISIDDVTGVKAATFDVYYDASLLSLSSDNISFAELWTSENGWSMLANVVRPGRLRIGMSNPEATETGGGVIINVAFTVLPEAVRGLTALDIEHASRRNSEDGFFFIQSDGSIAIN